MRSLLLTALLLLPPLAGAEESRLYQWQDPQTGRTQMSGRAPGWYRGLSDGPRVLVFRRGVLMDDTAVAVSDELRQQLRAEALTAAVRDAAPSGARAPAEASAATAVTESEAEVAGRTKANADPGRAPADDPAADVAASEFAERTRARALETLGRLDALFLESAARALEAVQGRPPPPPADPDNPGANP